MNQNNPITWATILNYTNENHSTVWTKTTTALIKTTLLYEPKLFYCMNQKPVNFMNQKLYCMN